MNGANKNCEKNGSDKMYRYLGKIVNTHGIKGEIRILSDFEKKELVFRPDFEIYIGEEKKKEIIQTYRHHKNFEMITLRGYQNINEVLKYLKKSVYIKREDLQLKKEEYLIEELIGCDVISFNEKIGKITEIVYNKSNILLQVKAENEKKFYIPNQKEFIIQVNLEQKQVLVQNIQGLII